MPLRNRSKTRTRSSPPRPERVPLPAPKKPAKTPPTPPEPEVKAKVHLEDRATRSLREERAEIFEGGLLKRKLSPEEVDEILSELEVALFEADIAQETVEAMKKTVREALEGARVAAFSNRGDLVNHALQIAVENALPPD